MKSLGSIRARLANLLAETIRSTSAGPDKIAEMLRAKIAAGAQPMPTTPQVRAEAEARVGAWLARGTVRA
jgi:hypothetical protein